MNRHPRRSRLPRSARFGLLIALLAAAVTAGIAWQQTRNEHRRGLDDLEWRARLLAHRNAPAAQLALGRADTAVQAAIGDRLNGHSRLLGMAIYHADGLLAAALHALRKLGAVRDLDNGEVGMIAPEPAPPPEPGEEARAPKRPAKRAARRKTGVRSAGRGTRRKPAAGQDE